MNLTDASVLEVLGEPYESWGKWWVRVSYNSCGYPGETVIMFKTKEEAESVKEGYEFLI